MLLYCCTATATLHRCCLQALLPNSFTLLYFHLSAPSLCKVIVVHPPSDPLALLQPPLLPGATALVAHVEGDAMRLFFSPEDIYVVRNEKLACTWMSQMAKIRLQMRDGREPFAWRSKPEVHTPIREQHRLHADLTRGVSAFLRSGLEGRWKLPRACCCCTPPWNKGRRSMVWFPFGLTDASFQPLILSRADLREEHSMFTSGCRVAVIEDWNAELFRCQTPKFVCTVYTILHGGPLYGDEGADVAGTHTRMLSLVITHVDPLGGNFARVDCPAHNRCRATNKSVHGAVGRLPRIDIEESTPGSRSDCVGYGADHILVAAFREVRNTFDERGRHADDGGTLFSVCRPAE